VSRESVGVHVVERSAVALDLENERIYRFKKQTIHQSSTIPPGIQRRIGDCCCEELLLTTITDLSKEENEENYCLCVKKENLDKQEFSGKNSTMIRFLK
jgi:hypothetical protein